MVVAVSIVTTKIITHRGFFIYVRSIRHRRLRYRAIILFCELIRSYEHYNDDGRKSETCIASCVILTF